MKKTILFLCISLIATLSFSQTKSPRLKKIFNGKNLDGWVVPEDKSCFTVSKGILTIKSNAEKKGAILWTTDTYENFIVQGEFKMGDGVVDSGFFLRSENDQIQIGISGSLKKDMTASPYIPKLRYPVEAKVKDILKPKEWNTMKIKVVGKTYTVWLNGVEVMTYTSENIPPSGAIGLQLHPNNEMTIYYKNIKAARI